MKHKFDFGVTAKDIITGFTGIVTSRHEYMTGCTQYALQPKVDERGKKNQSEFFDETRLIQQDAERVELPHAEEVNPGCDDRERP